jgi:hypothetical protein
VTIGMDFAKFQPTPYFVVLVASLAGTGDVVVEIKEGKFARGMRLESNKVMKMDVLSIP